MPAQRSGGRIPGDADGSTRRRRGTWKTAPALAAGIAFALPTAAEQRAFRIGPITPPVHVWNKEVAALGETLKERSDGRFGLAVFPPGPVRRRGGDAPALQTGALDMAWMTAAAITFRVPDIADAARVLRSDEARETRAWLPRATGSVGLCYAMIGMRQMAMRNPIGSAAALKGQRIRIAPAPAIRRFVEMCGAAPAPMPLPAIDDALADGQVDGLAMDDEAIINSFSENARPTCSRPVTGCSGWWRWFDPAGLAGAGRDADEFQAWTATSSTPMSRRSCAGRRSGST